MPDFLATWQLERNALVHLHRHPLMFLLQPLLCLLSVCASVLLRFLGFLLVAALFVAPSSKPFSKLTNHEFNPISNLRMHASLSFRSSSPHNSMYNAARISPASPRSGKNRRLSKTNEAFSTQNFGGAPVIMSLFAALDSDQESCIKPIANAAQTGSGGNAILAAPKLLLLEVPPPPRKCTRLA